MPSAESLLVFISHRDNTCCGCGEELGKGAWTTLEGERGVSCLSCADLNHLVYLPATTTTAATSAYRSCSCGPRPRLGVAAAGRSKMP